MYNGINICCNRGRIMSSKRKLKIFKIALIIIIILIFIMATLYFFPIIKNLSTKEGQIAFKEKVEDSRIIGMLSLFGLQVAQIFLVIIPGEPMEVLAGMCYGGIGGLIFIAVSAGIITTIIVLLVRKFGRKFVYEFCNKEKIEKLENSEWFKNPRKLENIMAVLFLIPGTPKDLLVYIAGLLPINMWKFILISVIARFPSIISSTFAGENLIEGNWETCIVIYGVTFLISAISIFFINRKSKKI